jgi:hypothetical protein
MSAKSTTQTVQQIALGQLRPHPKNYQQHPPAQIAKLAASLKRFGQRKNIVVWQQDGFCYTIAGHGLVEAAQSIKAPALLANVFPLDTPEDEILGYMVADNETARWAEPDLAQLEALLQAQLEAGYPLESVGYTLDELEALQAQLEAEAQPEKRALDDPGGGGDAFDPSAAETRCKAGELWQLGKHRLLCGDSTKQEDVQRLMDGEKIDMVWFDPPFGINLVPQRQLNEPIANDGQHEAQTLWHGFLPLLFESMADDTVAFLCQRWSEFDWTLPLIRDYFTIKSEIIWFKTQWGIGYYLRPQHETILYCWKGTPPKPAEAISDVWEVARPAAPDHAAEKPVALMARAIAFASQPKQVIADWFAGVGGTVIACERTERLARLCEIEPRYCDVILARWEAETGEKAVRL